MDMLIEALVKEALSVASAEEASHLLFRYVVLGNLGDGNQASSDLVASIVYN